MTTSTSHDNEGTMSIASSLVPCTAGTMVYTATSGFAYLPLTTCVSGAIASVKFAGLVKTVDKTTVAWLAGSALSCISTLTFQTCTVGGISQANAYDAGTAAAVTGDVILRLPCVGA